MMKREAPPLRRLNALVSSQIRRNRTKRGAAAGFESLA
jgi:hypothetical protein